MFAEATTGPTLLSRAADGSWRQQPVGAPIHAECEDPGDSRLVEGERCEHRAS